MPRTTRSGLTAQTPFPILKLPPEIRNHIWRYTVVKDEYVIIRRHGRQKLIKDLVPSRLRSGKELQRHQEDDDRRINSTQLALAFTSRQIYLETTLIFYSENTFAFPCAYSYSSTGSVLEGFTADIGPQNAGSITTACLVLDYRFIGTLRQHLSVLPGLKQLTLYKDPCLCPCEDCSTAWPAQFSEFVQSNPSVVVEHCSSVGVKRDGYFYALRV